MRQWRESELLLRIFNTLLGIFGPQNWWPGDTPLEIMIGAILTQNTNWKNVEKAINNLKRRVKIEVDSILSISNELPEILKPAGYYRIKSKRVLEFLHWLKDRGGVSGIKSTPTDILREELLKINGIGEETADSILLYGLRRPIFVVDAYTKRVLKRHGIVPRHASYQEIQQLFHDKLEPSQKLFNEFHALFVKLGKIYCKVRPHCEKCPLLSILGEPISLEIKA